MFFIKKNWFTGYITIEVRGVHPELFFQILAKHGVMSWDIEKKTDTVAIGKVKLTSLMKIREVKRQTRYKLFFTGRHGLPFTSKQLINKKPLILGFLLALILIFLLSNIVWRVEVTGLDPDMETEVTETLEEYGVEIGSFQWDLAPPGVIQRQLLADIPELLWVGVKKNGSAYHLEGVEKTIVEKEEETPPGHLVAAKEGVIHDLFITKGQPLVRTDDVVSKGDMLVSGYLKQVEEEEEEEEKRTAVGADGKVIAEVWYRSDVTVPIEQHFQTLKGTKEVKHYLRLKKWLLPVWNLDEPSFPQYQVEADERAFYFLKWKLPISYIKQTIYETEETTQQLQKEQAKQLALAHARREIERKTPPESKILDEKVLHESAENGKVKITLYYSVLEDIATKQPISQGD
ncbi:sporulation protein YqfD [Gracilibacillus phocaeensis]|uniref:sporulation protein YqfD n=1 Tax=Gracilibacillus phocaeensis TaxID=2042304 RepID=UPI001031B9E5|nr:sporulation protein YqfD [Gracilibacillus phocaeensis]